MGARGRETHYKEEFVELAFKFALAGHTDEEIAALLGIGKTSLYEYRIRYPEFADALKRGKAPADAEVTHALFDNATIQKNVTAQIFWLKNRQPDRWRDRAEPAKIELELTYKRDPERFGRVIDQEETQSGAGLLALISSHPQDIQEHLRLVLSDVSEDQLEKVYNQAIGPILAAANRGSSEVPADGLAERQNIQPDVVDLGSDYMANLDDETDEEKQNLQDALRRVESHNAKVRSRPKK